jgi:hypothetical protein
MAVTWTLSARDANSLLVFGRQTSRRMYGADEAEEWWKVGNNDESEKLLRRYDVVRYTRAQKIKWWE